MNTGMNAAPNELTTRLTMNEGNKNAMRNASIASSRPKYRAMVSSLTAMAMAVRTPKLDTTNPARSILALGLSENAFDRARENTPFPQGFSRPPYAGKDSRSDFSTNVLGIYFASDKNLRERGRTSLQ